MLNTIDLNNTIQDISFDETRLGMRVKSIVLVNVQGVDDIRYEFPESGIFRICAPSEVGKSILTKSVQVLISKEFQSKEAFNAMRRDDTDKTLIAMELYNDNMVALLITDKNIYHITLKEGEKKIIPYTGETPHEVIDILGFYVDYETGFSLNVQETNPVLFVDTTERLNNNILNCSLSNDILENAIKKVKLKQAEATNILLDLESDMNKLTFALNGITLEDEVGLMDKIKYQDNLLTIANSILCLDTPLTEITEFLLKLNNKIDINFNKNINLDIGLLDILNTRLDIHDLVIEIKHLESKNIEKLNDLSTELNLLMWFNQCTDYCTEIIDKVVKLQDTKLAKIDKDLDKFILELKELNTLDDLNTLAKSDINIILNTKIEKAEKETLFAIKQLEDVCTYDILLNNISQDLKYLENINLTNVPNIDMDLSKLEDLNKYDFSSIFDIIVKLDNLIDNKENSIKELNNVSTVLKELGYDVMICPVCKQSLNEEVYHATNTHC